MTAYIESRRSVFGVEPTCRVLGVATSTHYARLSRSPSARAIRDAVLVTEIHAAREGYRSRYGVRKTWKQLKRQGVTDAGRERVARLMRQEGLRGQARVQRGRTPRTTRRDETAVDSAEDLVSRDFTASWPNQLWVADLTYVRTWQGFGPSACANPRLVTWSPTPTADRSTHRCTTDRLDEHGIAPSLGSRGDAYDNAMAEAWVATYKSELVQHRLLSYEHLEHETLQWISFYNHDRLHEELGDVPPSEYDSR